MKSGAVSCELGVGSWELRVLLPTSYSLLTDFYLKGGLQECHDEVVECGWTLAT